MRRLSIVLVAPRIPANVGNIARTCLALQAELHLVGPFGFFFDNKQLRRGAVGYWAEVQTRRYVDSEEFWKGFPRNSSTRFYWATKDGDQIYSDQKFGRDVCIIFGNEDEGVDPSFWNFKDLPNIAACRIPTHSVRCLNLANSAAIMGFEVQRQWGKQASQLRAS